MTEIEATELTPPSVEGVLRGARSRRRRRLTLGMVGTVFLVALGGGGTVIASSLLAEERESSAILSVDVGRPVAGTGPGVVVTEGVTRGQIWRTRTTAGSDGGLCAFDVNPVTDEAGGGSCGGPVTVNGVVVPDVIKVSWGGSASDNHDGSWSYQVLGTTTPDVARVRLTWDGVKEPIMLTAVPLNKDRNVFTLMIVAEGGPPKFDLVGLDANGQRFPSIDPPE
ncbi:hypothetical protein [Streptomyces sp. SID3343]|uniref:hypothetical protein n=1 Tax=Streptomyces sp. SID3343 TaxID=2690260 RepID=UPI001368D835|nr:hypothetical protein [Streptomyces sp. SID3343]MYW03197.1 hypothetical protein [Streptomyces sp. SID3343]